MHVSTAIDDIKTYSKGSYSTYLELIDFIHLIYHLKSTRLYEKQFDMDKRISLCHQIKHRHIPIELHTIYYCGMSTVNELRIDILFALEETHEFCLIASVVTFLQVPSWEIRKAYLLI